nr:hypothetical protein [Tanacetum cinerariifolium]
MRDGDADDKNDGVNQGRLQAKELNDFVDARRADVLRLRADALKRQANALERRDVELDQFADALNQRAMLWNGDLMYWVDGLIHLRWVATERRNTGRPLQPTTKNKLNLLCTPV